MNKIILIASALVLVPGAAQAQLLGGGGGLGGGLGGGFGGTLGGTIERTTTTVRSTAESTVSGQGSTRGSQSVDARKGSVQAERSAEGSIAGSTASLADLVVPPMGGMADASGNGSASGQGNANAQLFGTDAVTGTLTPMAGRGKEFAGNAMGTVQGAASQATSTAPGLVPSVPTAAPASAAGEGSGSASGNGSASLAGPVFAAAGSAAAAGQGAFEVSRGMPVMTPDGASLGKVRGVVANNRGEVEQIVVKQGKITRELPAGMFSASGNALVAGEARAVEAEPVPSTVPSDETATD
jgi:hypothetical protein